MTKYEVIKEDGEHKGYINVEDVRDQSLVVMDQIDVVQTESNTEPLRKLASIRRITGKEPIEGADMIECVHVDGWRLVTQKSNNFQIGDLVVYFEIDSFLPVCETFEFLRKSSFRSTKHLGDGFKIKTIKLKGQVSQGLVLPLSELDTFGTYWRGIMHNSWSNDFDSVRHEEGADLTKYLGVQKYEKPLDPRLAGRARGNFPSFIRKTDQERVQNLFGKLKGHKSEYNPDTGEVTHTGEHIFDQDARWEVTLKLDGSSMTVYLYQDRFGVASRNLDLDETDDNTFWQVARKRDLEGKLRSLGRNLALQGELMGPGVQDNRERLPEHEFFLFDVWDIDEQRYLTPTERHALPLHNVATVPFVCTRSLKDFESIDEMLAFADRKSLNHDIAEGVVFKMFEPTPAHQITSFKAINNKFLLKEKD
jgi:RNA ligase (TIGR02306 family)